MAGVLASMGQADSAFACYEVGIAGSWSHASASTAASSCSNTFVFLSGSRKVSQE